MPAEYFCEYGPSHLVKYSPILVFDFKKISSENSRCAGEFEELLNYNHMFATVNNDATSITV